MKKTFTILIIMALFNHVAIAQHTRFGIQAGMSLAQVRSEYDGGSESLDYKPGLIGGVLVDVKLGDHFFLQPEFNWVQKGGRQTNNLPNNTTITFRTTLNYLELPLKILYRSSRDHGFFIGGGPAVAYGLYGNMKVGDQKIGLHFGYGDSGPWGPDLNEIGKPLDLSLIATAGFLTKSGFQLAFTYDYALNDYSNDPSYTMRNNYFALRAGYLFRSGKH